MRINVYSVYDCKLSAFTPPFFMLRDAEAIRAFSDTCMTPTVTLNKHPEDFTLHKLGVFDDQSGKLESIQPPEFLASATEFVKKGDQKDATT